MGGERDLLFGILAVQLGFVTSKQLVAAGGAWAADRSIGIAERLDLSDDNRKMLDAMVAQAIAVNADDPKKTLERMGGDRVVLQSFGGTFAGDDFEVAPEPVADGEHYTIGEELGRGGIGRVLLATDNVLERPVAMKELLTEEAEGTSSSYAKRLLREAKITGQLEHPNIMPVHELGTHEDGRPYYTMKVVRGRTLSQAIGDAKGLDERLALLDHFSDLCNAIAYAHSQGVVHRDIKPDNVMVGEFGETVALDWGLAKHRDAKEDTVASQIRSDVQATMEGQAIGTPAYMSPEQAEGLIEAIDETSDVWGLGAVLHEILSGAPPFSGATPLEVIGKVMASKPTRLREGPKELIAIAEKALSPAKTDRYPSAKALAEEVDAYRSGRRIEAYEYSSVELLTRFIQKNRAASIAAGAIVVAAAVAALVSTSALRDTQRALSAEADARSTAEKQTRNAQHALAQSRIQRARQLIRDHAYGEAATLAATTIASGPYHPKSDNFDSTLAKTVIEDAQTALRSIYFEATQRRQLYFVGRFDGLPGAKQIDAAPDGKHFAVSSGSGELAVWNVDEGKTVGRISRYAPNLRYKWAKSNDALYMWGAQLERWTVGDEQPTPISKGIIVPLRTIADGRVVVWANEGIKLFDPDTKSKTHLVAAEPNLRDIQVAPDGATFIVLFGDRLERWETGGRRLASRATERDGFVWFEDARLLALVDGSRTIELVDADTFEPRGAFDFGAVAALGVAVDKTSRLIVPAPDGLALVDAKRKAVVDRISLAADPHTSFSISDKGDLFVAHSSGRVSHWRIEPPRVQSLPHDANIWSLAMATDGTLVTGTATGKVHRWRKGVGRVVANHGVNAVAVAASAKHDRGASISSGGALKLWRLSDGKPIASVDRAELHYGGRWYGMVDVMPDGTFVFSGADLLVHFMAPEDGRIVRTSYFSPGYSTGVAVNDDGSRFAFGNVDGRIYVAEVGPERVRPLLLATPNTTGPTTGLSFSSDSRRIAAGGHDATIKIYDIESKRVVQQFHLHRGWINATEYSPDDRWLLTASDDETVAIVEADTGKKYIHMSVGGEAGSARWIEDGRRFVTASGPNAELFEFPTDVFEEDPRKLVERTRPVPTWNERRTAPINPGTVVREVPGVGKTQVGGTVTTNDGRAPVAGAKIDIIDAKTAAVFTSTKTNGLGQYVADVPNTSFGIRLTSDRGTRYVFGSIAEPGLADGLIWADIGDWKVWTLRAPIPVDPKKNVLFGLVRYGSRTKYTEMSNVGCGTLTLEPNLPVYYTDVFGGHTTRSSVDPTSAGFRAYNLEPDQHYVLRAEIGGKHVEYDIPPLPGGTVVNVRVRFSAEDLPKNPTPADCRPPVVKTY